MSPLDRAHLRRTNMNPNSNTFYSNPSNTIPQKIQRLDWSTIVVGTLFGLGILIGGLYTLLYSFFGSNLIHEKWEVQVAALAALIVPLTALLFSHYRLFRIPRPTVLKVMSIISWPFFANWVFVMALLLLGPYKMAMENHLVYICTVNEDQTKCDDTREKVKRIPFIKVEELDRIIRKLNKNKLLVRSKDPEEIIQPVASLLNDTREIGRDFLVKGKTVEHNQDKSKENLGLILVGRDSW